MEKITLTKLIFFSLKRIIVLKWTLMYCVHLDIEIILNFCKSFGSQNIFLRRLDAYCVKYHFHYKSDNNMDIRYKENSLRLIMWDSTVHSQHIIHGSTEDFEFQKPRHIINYITAELTLIWDTLAASFCRSLIIVCSNLMALPVSCLCSTLVSGRVRHLLTTCRMFHLH